MSHGEHGSRPRAPRLLRTVAGVLCLAAGAALLGRPALRILRERLWQSDQAERFEDSRDLLDGPAAPDGAGPSPAAGATPPDRVEAAPPRRGEAVARLRIHRVGLDSIIAEGTDDRTLARGPGHMEGTALPGEADNCIIAGHRDGEFARLGKVREGDVIEIVRAHGTSRYAVTEVHVVDRHDTALLAPSRDPLLTLITCYPFDWKGPAPRRLVVRGRLLTERAST